MKTIFIRDQLVIWSLAFSILACGSWFQETSFAGQIVFPQETRLPLSIAQQAAEKAIATCSRDGYHVSVAVVDRGGTLKALLRADGAGPHTTDSSFKKAYTSASLGRSTKELAVLLAKVPALQGLRDMNNHILILGGGLPIIIHNETIGGIGVGGAPGDRFDEACARAGLGFIKTQ